MRQTACAACVREGQTSSLSPVQSSPARPPPSVQFSDPRRPQARTGKILSDAHAAKRLARFCLEHAHYIIIRPSRIGALPSGPSTFALSAFRANLSKAFYVLQHSSAGLFTTATALRQQPTRSAFTRGEEGPAAAFRPLCYLRLPSALVFPPTTNTPHLPAPTTMNLCCNSQPIQSQCTYR